jgi:hypothetical protein
MPYFGAPAEMFHVEHSPQKLGTVATSLVMFHVEHSQQEQPALFWHTEQEQPALFWHTESVLSVSRGNMERFIAEGKKRRMLLEKNSGSVPRGTLTVRSCHNENIKQVSHSTGWKACMFNDAFLNSRDI